MPCWSHPWSAPGARKQCKKRILAGHSQRRISRSPRESAATPKLCDCWRNIPWVLKKSLFGQNRRNGGGRKCPSDPREWFIGHPDAILFWRISRYGVFQHPRLLTSAIGPHFCVLQRKA